jgi:hypothetical protein
MDESLNSETDESGSCQNGCPFWNWQNQGKITS